MNRRKFIKLTGAISISPVLTSLFKGLHKSALGQIAVKDSFIQYNIANGMTRPCVRRGRGENGEVIAGPMFMPLQNYLQNITVVDTLVNENGKYQHGNGASAWTCAGPINGGGAAGSEIGIKGPSLDWRIAQALSANPDQTSAIFAMPYRMGGGNCGPRGTISGKGQDLLLLPEYNLYRAWERYFDVTSNPNENQNRLKGKLISKVMEDTKRQMNLLPGSEKAKAEQYMDSLNQLEKAISFSQSTCEGVLRPTQRGVDITEDGVETERRRSKHLPNYWQAFVDMSANLISCGLKNQITLLHSMGCAHMSYDSGRNDGTRLDHHWHDSDPSFRGGETGEDMDRILSIHTTYINSILDKLSQAPGNPGESMADRTKIMLGSDGGGRHHAGFDKYCVVLYSGANTNLAKGRYIDGKGRPLADFLLTLLKSFDPSATSFGDGTNGGSTILSELIGV